MICLGVKKLKREICSSFVIVPTLDRKCALYLSLDWATDEHRFSQIKKAVLSDLCFICVNLWLTPPCFFRLFMISAASALSAV
jgi:hypothetical protein